MEFWQGALEGMAMKMVPVATENFKLKAEASIKTTFKMATE